MLFHLGGEDQVVRVGVDIAPLRPFLLAIRRRRDESIVDERSPCKGKRVLGPGYLAPEPADDQHEVDDAHADGAQDACPRERIGERFSGSRHGRATGRTVEDHRRDRHRSARHMSVGEEEMRGREHAAIGEDVHEHGFRLASCRRRRGNRRANGLDGGHQSTTMSPLRGVQPEIGRRAQEEDDARRGSQTRVCSDVLDQDAGCGAEPECDDDC